MQAFDTISAEGIRIKKIKPVAQLVNIPCINNHTEESMENMTVLHRFIRYFR